MKQKRFNKVLLFLTLICTACSGELQEEISVLPQGEPVNLSFDLYTASTTKAEGAADMPAGSTFRIYAYAKGDLDNVLGEAIYTVDANAKATGNLPLYRGEYDMYLVSYNSATEVPKQNTGKISVKNGYDFMYTTLKSIVVQPETAGKNSMTVQLPEPFTRMGAQVVVAVAAKNGQQPVAISSLRVNSITVEGLPSALDYQLGSTAWEDATNYNTSFKYTHFTRKDDSYYTPWISEPAVLLPIDGSQYLKFTVNLTVDYDNGKKSLTADYPASIQKVLLPGMTYKFDFTLTFYGALIPTDLTLAVKEYNTINLSSDELGKD